MTVIQDRKNKILAYNQTKDLSPLKFVKNTGVEYKIPKSDLKFNRNGTPHRKNLIKVLLYASTYYYSKNTVTGEIETPPRKNRSIIDIWRHALYLYPNISLFKLMESMHSLCSDGEVFGQACKIIKRAVFRTHDMRPTNINFRCPEYNISFNSWKTLHD